MTCRYRFHFHSFAKYTKFVSHLLTFFTFLLCSETQLFRQINAKVTKDVLSNLGYRTLIMQSNRELNSHTPFKLLRCHGIRLKQDQSSETFNYFGSVFRDEPLSKHKN